LRFQARALIGNLLLTVSSESLRCGRVGTIRDPLETERITCCYRWDRLPDSPASRIKRERRPWWKRSPGDQQLGGVIWWRHPVQTKRMYQVQHWPNGQWNREDNWRKVEAASAKEAAEKVCGLALTEAGRLTQLRARVFTIGDRKQRSATQFFAVA
jgi:hypothetical protein